MSQSLRLLSFNIQIGIATRHYRQYLWHGWKHLLHHPRRFDNLDRIAALMRDYDLVGIQETDAGSARSGFVNLTRYLAEAGGFPCWSERINRRIGRMARHSLGVLSRFQPVAVVEHRLPGPISGRGALEVRYGQGTVGLVLLVVHLALSRRVRLQQIDFLCTLVNRHRHVIVMGDMNCTRGSAEMNRLLLTTRLEDPLPDLPTWPSWKPRRDLDHILLTPELRMEQVEVLDFPLSDHLPLALQVRLPEGLRLCPAAVEAGRIPALAPFP